MLTARFSLRGALHATPMAGRFTRLAGQLALRAPETKRLVIGDVRLGKTALMSSLKVSSSSEWLLDAAADAVEAEQKRTLLVITSEAQQVLGVYSRRAEKADGDTPGGEQPRSIAALVLAGYCCGVVLAGSADNAPNKDSDHAIPNRRNNVYVIEMPERRKTPCWLCHTPTTNWRPHHFYHFPYLACSLDSIKEPVNIFEMCKGCNTAAIPTLDALVPLVGKGVVLSGSRRMPFFEPVRPILGPCAPRLKPWFLATGATPEEWGLKITMPAGGQSAWHLKPTADRVRGTTLQQIAEASQGVH